MGKKIIAFMLAAMLILSFAGCGEKVDNNSGSEVSSLGSSASATESKAKSDNSGEITFNSGEITLENVLNHETSPESDFKYSADSENSSEVGLGYYTGKDSIVVVPETLDGRPVVKVDDRAFCSINSTNENMGNVRAIKFADSIVEIEENACSLENLEIAVLGSGTKTLNSYSFFQCRALREVILNEGLETIKTGAFAWCDNLKSIEIPASVKTIEPFAFDNTATNYFTIYGKAGSAAEEYAKSENIKFVAK